MSDNTNTNTETYIENVIVKIHTRKSSQPAIIESKANTRCAPGKVFEAGSCARLVVMNEMAKAYNKMHAESPIRMSKNLELLNPQRYKLYLVHELEKRFTPHCDTQKCWGRRDFINHMEKSARTEFLKYTHRPDSLQGKFEWLGTFDINDVMDQYYTSEKGFKFFGAVPMDFEEIRMEIGNVDYESYIKSGVTKFGVIFNLDNHNQSGSHWTAMYSDFDKNTIYYFDSFGTKPEPRVRALMRQQVKYLESIGKDVNLIVVDYNQVQHQKGNSECGVYSINFLVRMARGDDFEKLVQNPVSDKQINRCRKIYFDKYTIKAK
jgi:hypothetical protein